MCINIQKNFTCHISFKKKKIDLMDDIPVESTMKLFGNILRWLVPLVENSKKL